MYIKREREREGAISILHEGPATIRNKLTQSADPRLNVSCFYLSTGSVSGFVSASATRGYINSKMNVGPR